jgi:hypothetical protein
MRAKTRDSGLILTKPRVSLAILPHEGVSGHLDHTIANERSRSDPVGERPRVDGRARLISGTERTAT